MRYYNKHDNIFCCYQTNEQYKIDAFITKSALSVENVCFSIVRGIIAAYFESDIWLFLGIAITEIFYFVYFCIYYEINEHYVAMRLLSNMMLLLVYFSLKLARLRKYVQNMASQN
jgi:hypothetical protein